MKTKLMGLAVLGTLTMAAPALDATRRLYLPARTGRHAVCSASSTE